MASKQVSGIMRFYKVTDTDVSIPIHTVNMSSIGAGGSPDGAIANSPEKWSVFPYFGGDKALGLNDRLRVTFEASATATVDASDGAFVLPVTLADGSVTFLGHPTKSAEWNIRVSADKEYVADIETPAFEMQVKRAFALGSSREKAFISMEDNTA